MMVKKWIARDLVRCSSYHIDMRYYGMWLLILNSDSMQRQREEEEDTTKYTNTHLRLIVILVLVYSFQHFFVDTFVFLFIFCFHLCMNRQETIISISNPCAQGGAVMKYSYAGGKYSIDWLMIAQL